MEASTTILFAVSLLAAAGPLQAALDVLSARPRTETLTPLLQKAPALDGWRVVGGEAAARGQFPHQAAVYLTLADGNTYFCGGSLVSARYVLTAAHCTRDALQFEVVLGATVPSNRTEPGRVSFRLGGDSIDHPDYNPRNKLYDVALLRLPEEAPLSALIQPIRLPSRSQARNNHSFEGDLAVVSGWGRVSDDDPYISTVLNHATVPVIGNPLCMLYFLSALYGISPTQVCSGGNLGTNACNGDSGGPLLVVEADGVATQIGLVSLGFSECEKGWPTAYSRLTSFLDFIADNSDVQLRD